MGESVNLTPEIQTKSSPISITFFDSGRATNMVQKMVITLHMMNKLIHRYRGKLANFLLGYWHSKLWVWQKCGL